MEWRSRFEGRALLAGLLVTGGAALWGVLGYEGDRVVYARSVDEVVRNARELAGRALRVDGVLLPSSVKMGGSPCVARFVLSGGAERLEVLQRACSLPDSMCGSSGWEQRIVIEGELDARTGIFEAERVLARCPNKYEIQVMRLDGGARSDVGCPCPGSAPSAQRPAE